MSSSWSDCEREDYLQKTNLLSLIRLGRVGCFASVDLSSVSSLCGNLTQVSSYPTSASALFSPDCVNCYSMFCLVRRKEMIDLVVSRLTYFNISELIETVCLWKFVVWAERHSQQFSSSYFYIFPIVLVLLTSLSSYFQPRTLINPQCQVQRREFISSWNIFNHNTDSVEDQTSYQILLTSYSCNPASMWRQTIVKLSGWLFVALRVTCCYLCPGEPRLVCGVAVGAVTN